MTVLVAGLAGALAVLFCWVGGFVGLLAAVASVSTVARELIGSR